MLSGVRRCEKLKSEVCFPRTRMAARQPIHPDFTEMRFPGGFETSGTRIRDPFGSNENDRLGANGDRDPVKQIFLRYLDGGNMRLSSAD